MDACGHSFQRPSCQLQPTGKVQSQELLGRHLAAWEVRPGAEGAPGGKTPPRPHSAKPSWKAVRFLSPSNTEVKKMPVLTQKDAKHSPNTFCSS